MEQALFIVRELTRGMEQTRQLKAQIGLEVSGKIEGTLIDEIISSYENAIAVLKRGQSQQHITIPGSPHSITENPGSKDLNPGFNVRQGIVRDFSRKRKAMPSWTEQVRVKSQNGLEVPTDKGYSWRKYGQKDILGAAYPRSYYRCTYRDTQGCCASKQVQRNDQDPSLFDITCKGKHTCTLAPRSKLATSSPEKKQQQNTQHYIPIPEYNQQTNMTTDFPTENIEYQHSGLPIGSEDYNFMSSVLNENNFSNSFSPSFVLSPANSESTYFSTSLCNMSNYGEGRIFHVQQSESSITDIISATTSVTNSPLIGIDFPEERWEFNTIFPFDDPAFFPSFSQAKE